MSDKVVIIGNGVAGISTAIELRNLSDCDITVISDETEYFFSRTALMYVYMGHMKFEHTQPYENSFWSKNRIELKKATISKVNPSQNSLTTAHGEEIIYDFLVIATGSVPNRLNWPGQNLKGVSGLYHKSDLEYIEAMSDQIRSAVIVGGGLIGIELAEMLISRGKKVSFLIRESSFWSPVLSENEGRFLEKHIREHHVELLLENELKSINGTEKVNSVSTSKGYDIPCDYVGLTIGVRPNIDFLKDSGIETKRGVLVNPYLQTNYENIYAAGDCAELINPPAKRRPIEAVWYTGKKMGKQVAENMFSTHKKAYEPGHWFNSAKFFDIEYQTYGQVPAMLGEHQSEWYWEKGQKAVRMVFDKPSRIFEGINTFGIRMRQEFFEKALDGHWTVDRVVQELGKANFDPEFFKKIDLKREFELSH